MRCTDVLKGVMCAVVSSRAPNPGASGFSGSALGRKLDKIALNPFPKNLLATYLEFGTSVKWLSKN